VETVLKNILSILLVVLLVPGSEFLLRIVNTDFRTYPKHSIKLRLRLLQVYTGSFLAIMANSSSSSSKGWLSNLSSIANRVYFFLIILQIPLFRYISFSHPHHNTFYLFHFQLHSTFSCFRHLGVAHKSLSKDMHFLITGCSLN
jgi:hypothetical protein